MKAAISPATGTTVPWSAVRQRAVDLVGMTKPRIAVMVLITVAGGYVAAAGADTRIAPLLHVVLGTALVASAASVWNGYLERQSDGKMRRTAGRPLPSGRLHPFEAAVFGTILVVTGINYLLHAFATPWPAVAAALTFVLYVGVYTPAKPLTTFNTLVGAIPGAMPPVIGYLAAKETLDWKAWTVFAVLFCWQLPHFMAIAWMYRRDYADGGLRMLPTVDPSGSKTCRSMITWCIALIAVSMLPVYFGGFDVVYAVGAAAIGLVFLASTIQFARERTDARARRVLRASLVYLPVELGLLLLHVLVTGR